MHTRKAVIGLLVMIFVLSIITGVATMDTRDRAIRLENRIDHLDEEMDETATNVKKLLSRVTTSITTEETTPSNAKAEALIREHDFGKIKKQDGNVYADFTVKNMGTDALVIGEIVTSCGCTSATIDTVSIAPGETATVTVIFDPNFHEEPQGRFSRSVFVPTNDQNNKEIEFKIFIEIIN